ncbi:MAG: hypothetical protein methR_P2222 [Methyloprofundus sp.]|nr:MAG: hypothetical protein methR_P2222 [Methyloprofundus sp.]
MQVNVLRVTFLIMLAGLFSCAQDNVQVRKKVNIAKQAAAPATSKGLINIITKKGEQIELYNNSYALLIGVSHYTAGWPSLTAIPDELDDVERMLNQQGFTKVVRVDNPNKKQLRAAFNDFIDEYGYDAGNRLLFFYSGHGHSFDGDKRGYLVPTDAPNPHQNKKGFLRKALSMNQIMTWSRNMDAKHALFLFDSCFSGSVFQSKALKDTPKYISRLSTKSVRQFITAGNEEDEVPASSTFTPAFVSALEDGLADRNGDGYVTGSELGMYLQEEVPKSVRQMPQYGKISDFKLSRGDFIFVLDNNAGPEPVQPGKLTPVVPPPAPLLATGSLQVNVYVPDARITVNGMEYRASKGKPLNLSALPVGKLAITVAANGYETEQRLVKIKAGQWVQPQFYLPIIKPDPVPIVPPNPPVELGITPDMANIQGSCYQMGSPDWETDRDSDEQQHQVCVSDFQMGKKEVTVGEFRKFVRATGYRTQAEQNIKEQGCYAYSNSEKQWAWRARHYWDHIGFSQTNQHPVVCVSWMDVQNYIGWLNENSAGGYRLPTEAEWEYAARAGTQTAYFWGSAVDAKACRYANIADKAHNWSKFFPCDDGAKYTNTVASYRPNAFGLYDMSGNVWEWTCSKYDKNYSGGEKKCLSKNHASDGAKLVLRGGSFYSGLRRLRVAHRDRDYPWERHDSWGFRLARAR